MNAWIYLYPVVAFSIMVLILLILILITVNLVLGLGMVSLYTICPKEPLFDYIIETFRNPQIEKNIQETFSLEVKEPLPHTAIYIWSPHALMSISSFMCNRSMCKTDGYIPNHIVTIPLVQYFPIISDIARYFGVISSDYRSIENTLKKKESVSVMIGGVREMNMTEDYKIHLYARKRRGLFRLALTTGTPIVPVLTLGENELFPITDIPVLFTLNRLLYESFGISIPLPSLRSIQNWVKLSYGPLKPIRSYTGKVIEVTKKEDPTEDDIASLRDLYIAGVEEVFKANAGPEYVLQID
jgi:hypothetical protein